MIAVAGGILIAVFVLAVLFGWWLIGRDVSRWIGRFIDAVPSPVLGLVIFALGYTVWHLVV